MKSSNYREQFAVLLGNLSFKEHFKLSGSDNVTMQHGRLCWMNIVARRIHIKFMEANITLSVNKFGRNIKLESGLSFRHTVYIRVTPLPKSFQTVRQSWRTTSYRQV